MLFVLFRFSVLLMHGPPAMAEFIVCVGFVFGGFYLCLVCGHYLHQSRQWLGSWDDRQVGH